MPLFKITQTSLQPIKENAIRFEKDLQQLTEKNLERVLGLKFICSEFALNQFRIDTLAFDSESKSFVLIEYKRDKSFSVIDQGYAYLSLLLNNKADFVLEINEKLGTQLKKDDVDWSQSRVLFLAQQFTPYQKNAINFKDLPIELWEVKQYENDTVLFNQLKSPESSESIKTVSKDATIASVSRQVRSYTVDEHFKEGWEKSREIYTQLRERVLSLDERLLENPKKGYIGFKIENSNVIGVRVQKSRLLVDLTRTEPKDLKDPEKKVKYRKNSFKYYNQHISETPINNPAEVDYAMMLIKQVYERQVK